MQSKTRHDVDKGIPLSTLLGSIAIALGGIMLFVTCFLENDTLTYSIFLGLGVTLFPAGLFTLLTDYSFSKRLLVRVQNVMGSATADLKQSIGQLGKTNTFLEEANKMGLVRLYPDRSSALSSFFEHALSYVSHVSRDEAEAHSRSIVVVGSSLKGIWDNPNFADQLTDIIERGRDANCNFNVLLTHPHYSRYREGQESREKDDIAKEILHAIAWLKQRGIGSEHVKLYKGTPTCFLIATTERMLINPYPYQIEAYRCFCLEVVPTESPHSIYNSYWINHFKKPWEGEIETEDHRLVVNALSYKYYPLQGPVPDGHTIARDALRTLADVVVIQDSGECYISLNISQLPAQIPYDRKAMGQQSILQLGDSFRICLLNPEAKEWESLGEVRLNERRRGFWHGMLPEKDISAYQKIAVFPSRDESSPFKYPDESLEYLKGKSLPVLWQDLHSASNNRLPTEEQG